MHDLRRCLLAIRAIVLLFTSALHAQTTWFVRWEDEAGVTSIALYVDPAGSTNNSGLDPATALPTITAALSRAAQNNWLGSFPGTINVAQGLYDADSGQALPLQLPAYGVSLEAYTVGADGLPVIDLATESTGIESNNVGNVQLPPTEITGLEIIRVGENYAGVELAPLIQFNVLSGVG